jgi:hypothetical protein
VSKVALAQHDRYGSQPGMCVSTVMCDSTVIAKRVMGKARYPRRGTPCGDPLGTSRGDPLAGHVRYGREPGYVRYHGTPVGIPLWDTPLRYFGHAAGFIDAHVFVLTGTWTVRPRSDGIARQAGNG